MVGTAAFPVTFAGKAALTAGEGEPHSRAVHADPSPSDLTVEAWWSRVESKRAVAVAMVDDRAHCREAWQATGHAVEFALKAVIMKRERLNRWPDKEDRPELYTHDLRTLLGIAALDYRTLPRPLRASLKTVLDWDRSHDYRSGRMERRVARSMYEAAFGRDGAIPWLRTL